jgi:hypothetical protein
VVVSSGLGSVDETSAVFFGAGGGSDEAVVQRATQDTTPAQTVPLQTVALPARAAADAAESAGGGEEEGSEAGNLDQLARDVWSRIRPKLRRELQLDRERAGYLTDTRI